MANAIILSQTGKIKVAHILKELPMARSHMFDHVRPEQRLSIPFRFRWLKFKTGFFGLVLKKGGVQ